MSTSLKKAFKLDDAGNVVINKDYKVEWVEEKANFAQVIRNILLTITGEDFLAPWMGNDLLVDLSLARRVPPALYIEECIRKALLPEKEPRIKEIEELFIEEIEDRVWTVRLTVRDIYNDRTTVESRLMI